ncbi:MAG: hypothetical protein Rubg2KO_20280 [Rubricoccaceae bacterium]
MQRVSVWLLGLAMSATVTAQTSPDSDNRTPTRAQIETAAITLQNAVNYLDVDWVDTQVDGDALFDRAAEGMGYSEEMLTSARLGFIERLSLGATLTRNLGMTGDYTYLSTVERDGELRARFRLVTDGEAVNYHDVLFEADAQGEVQLVDLYAFTSGEDISQTMQRALVTFMSPDGSAPMEAVLIMEYLGAFQEGDYARVAEMYPALPTTEESRKMLAVTFVLASSNLTDAAYTKALDHFSSLYKSDPSLDLLLIDRYYLDADYAGALAALDRLDAAVDGDPYLDVYRITAYFGQGELDKARSAVDRLVEAFPNWEGSFSRRIDIALEQEDHTLVLRDMTVLEEDFGWEFDAVLIQKNWPEFASSPQFKTWTQRMDKK